MQSNLLIKTGRANVTTSTTSSTILFANYTTKTRNTKSRARPNASFGFDTFNMSELNVLKTGSNASATKDS